MDEKRGVPKENYGGGSHRIGQNLGDDGPMRKYLQFAEPPLGRISYNGPTRDADGNVIE